MKEAELDECLVRLQGLNNELNEDIQKKVGKLLVSAEDEDLSASSETYARLFQMAGGYRTVSFIVFTKIFLQYWSVYESSEL